MPVSVSRQEEYDCAREGCDATRTPTSSVDGSYCSEECAARAEGHRLLRKIRDDHRFCWSCWRQRKELESPTPEARRGLGPITDAALVGYEYHTDSVEMGPYGLECACGAVDPDIPDWGQRDAGPYQWFLYEATEQLVDEGTRESGLDLPTLCDALWQTDDLELAVGRALRATSD